MTRQTDARGSHRVRRLRMGLERLEDRTVPAYTATLSGPVATFIGDTASDTLIVDASGGNLRHNRATAGDPGFASDLDFDTTVAGNQMLAVGGGVITVSAGDGDDGLIIGSATAPAATLDTVFFFSGEGGTDTLVYDDQADTTGRAISVASGVIAIASPGSAVTHDTTEAVSVLAGTSGDLIVAADVSAGVSVFAGGGDDTIAFADGATLGGTVDGGAGTDTLDYSVYTTPVAVNLGANAPGFVATLGADQEVPPTGTAATGTAALGYIGGENPTFPHTFSLNLTVDGISPAEVTGIHIHRAPFGVNGPIIVDLGTAGLTPTATGFTVFFGTVIPLDPLHEAALMGGLTYVNVHTATFPDGAIRGQIVPSAPFVEVAGSATGTSGVSNVENATGGSGSFTVGGVAFGDSLVGNKQVNVLRGGEGNDVLVGVQGNDVVQGEGGDDVLVWSNGDNTDVMDGGAGADRVQVNGSLGVVGDIFTVAPGAGGRVDFDRTNLVPFGLDIGTVEQLVVLGLSGNDTFTVAALVGVAGLTGVTLAGLDGSDTFNVAPQSKILVTVQGGLPNSGAPGDALNVDTTGTIIPRLEGVAAGPGDSRSGSWVFDGLQPIAFDGIEQIAGSADLAVVLSDSPDPVAAGSELTYSVVVLNSGPVDATAAQFQMLVPVGTTFVSLTAPAGWTVAAPAAGGTGAITATRATFATADGPQIFTLRVLVGAAAAGSVTATATVASAVDPNPGNNSDTEGTAIAATADLGVTKTNGTLYVVPGATTTYTIVVTNAGPSNVAGVVVTDLFPGLSGVAFTAVGSGGATGFTATGGGTINDTLTLPVGASVTYTASGVVTLGIGEALANTVSLALPAGIADPNSGNNVATDIDAVNPPPAVLVGVPNFAVGPDAGGGPTVSYRNADGTTQFNLEVFDAAFTGGVQVAVADFTGDGVPDLVVGTGPGVATRVRVFDGVTKAQVFAVDPFEASFTGGVFVAAGDLTGDGRADLVITPDEGGGPRVRVFNGVGFGVAADFLGIEDPAFRGGARASIGDVNGDGIGDLLVAAGFGGGPRIAVFNGATLFDPLPAVVGALPPKLFGDFFVFEDTLRNGVFITSGDLDGDGFAEVIAGGGPGGGPRVFALSGQDLLSGTQTQRANFFAGDTESRGGVRLAVKDLDGDTRADLVTGAGTGAGSRVTAYAGSAIPVDGTPPTLLGFDAFPEFTGGVFVG